MKVEKLKQETPTQVSLSEKKNSVLDVNIVVALTVVRVRTLSAEFLKDCSSSNDNYNPKP